VGIENLFFKSILVSLLAGFGFFLFGNSLLLVVIGCRHIFGLRNQEAAGDVSKPSESTGDPKSTHRRNKILLRTALYSYLLTLAQVIYLPFIRSTPVIIWFYRGMGARIGAGTLIATTRIFDCDLVDIGSGCIIGGNTAIAAHSSINSYGILKRVVIGNNVTVGANVYIMPGVVIEDNVRIGPNSLVPMDKHLESGGTYLGVPVRRFPDLL
jgi:acetyltransferase-like isoleucine patch superfamily enzyme